MGLKFFKYCSTGNDFLLIESAPFEYKVGWSELCHRRFGVGADGILFYAPSESVDFEMVYLNSDGGRVGMCGNGARAVAKHFFLQNQGEDTVSFQVGSEIYHAYRKGQLIGVSMNELRDYQSIDLADLDPQCEVNDRVYLNTGVPHLLFQTEKPLHEIDLIRSAKPLRSDSRFAAGVNVSFYRLEGDKISLRTFERGVEEETYACGTGVAAVAQHLWHSGKVEEEQLTFSVKGGALEVVKTKDGLDLLGESKQVYSGVYDLK